MKKFYILLLCTAVLFLASCRQKSPDIATASISTGDEDPVDNSVDWIIPMSGVDLKGMNIYCQSDNLYFTADENAKLSLYVNTEKDNNGEFMFDDGQDWQLIMETSYGYYPLFPRTYVQLGRVDYTAFNAFDDQTQEYDIFHVIVTVHQSAGYRIYDCIFDNDRKAFKSVPVYDAENINPVGSLIPAVTDENDQNSIIPYTSDVLNENNSETQSSQEILSGQEALELVKNFYFYESAFEPLKIENDQFMYKFKDTNFYLETDNYICDDSGNYYIIHLYEVVIDDPLTGTGHTATSNWYKVNTETKEITSMFYYDENGEIHLNENF
ncbi:MAG: hypothetical protein FWD71_02770 [Oscillospiraceae bacterium]|nr:hypothetical protein [Oscillospiraceae bacterium]